MMNHAECLRYIENCALSIDHFTEYYLLDYYNGSYHVEKFDKLGDSYWIEIPVYVGDAFVNWFFELEQKG